MTPIANAAASLPQLSEPERALLYQIRALGLPVPKTQHYFHPTRRWRFDGAWPALLVAYEIDGGIWMRTPGGRSAGHAHPVRFEKDCEKGNAALLLGWRVLHFTPAMVNDGQALAVVEEVIQVTRLEAAQ